MKLFLITGFLGSGKITAILNAVQPLSAKGNRVAVITNDRGSTLVDTALFRSAEIEANEVTNRCSDISQMFP